MVINTNHSIHAKLYLTKPHTCVLSQEHRRSTCSAKQIFWPKAGLALSSTV